MLIANMDSKMPAKPRVLLIILTVACDGGAFAAKAQV
jgi:hypothetical protein